MTQRRRRTNRRADPQLIGGRSVCACHRRGSATGTGDCGPIRAVRNSTDRARAARCVVARQRVAGGAPQNGTARTTEGDLPSPDKAEEVARVSGKGGSNHRQPTQIRRVGRAAGASSARRTHLRACMSQQPRSARTSGLVQGVCRGVWGKACAPGTPRWTLCIASARTALDMAARDVKRNPSIVPTSPLRVVCSVREYAWMTD